MPFFLLPYKSNLACFCPQARCPWSGFAFVKKIFSRFQLAVLVSLTALTNSTMPQWFNLIQMYCLLPSPSLTRLVIIQEELRLLLSCDTTIVSTYPGHCRRCGQACTLLPLNFHWPALVWPQPNYKGAQEGRKEERKREESKMGLVKTRQCLCHTSSWLSGWKLFSIALWRSDSDCLWKRFLSPFSSKFWDLHLDLVINGASSEVGSLDIPCSAGWNIISITSNSTQINRDSE